MYSNVKDGLTCRLLDAANLFIDGATLIPETEPLTNLTEIHRFKQQSALAEVHHLFPATGIKSHPWRARWKIDNPSKHSAIAYDYSSNNIYQSRHSRESGNPELDWMPDQSLPRTRSGVRNDN